MVFGGVFCFGCGFGVDWLRWLKWLGCVCLWGGWLCGDCVVSELGGDVEEVVDWVVDCCGGDEWCGDCLVFEGFGFGGLRCWGCVVWVGDCWVVLFW